MSGEFYPQDLAKPDLVVIPDLNTTPGADNTAAVLSARTLSIAKNRPLWLPPGIWKMNDVLPAWNGARIIGYGATLDFQTDHTTTGRGLYATAVDDVEYMGLTLAQSNATARNGVYGMFSFLSSAGIGCSNVRVSDVRVTGGESTVIYSENMTDFAINGIVGANTWADGIHLARGTRRGTVRGVRIRNVGDDAIALVGITSENAGATTWQVMSDITIADFVIDSLPTVGSGVVVIGANRVNVGNGTVKSAKASGIYISDSAVIGAPAPSNVLISGVNIDTTTTGAGVRVGASTDVNITGITAVNCADSGVALIGSTRTYITASKLRGNTGFGLYEASGTSNAITACDLTGNSISPSQVASAVITACKTT